jgi:ferredoxin-NADP reductase
MSKPDATVEEPIVARVVHRSVIVDQPGQRPVIKLMLNLPPQGRAFEAGSDIAFMVPGFSGANPQKGLRRYTVEAVGEVPFEDSIDITVFVRDHGGGGQNGMAHHLMALERGDSVPVYGPFTYPFYPPMGSRSNMVLIGAGCGMVPFRWLARKIQARGLDWMGKVLMLEGQDTGLEHLYLNDLSANQDQYFDTATYRALEALKTRYSATALDHAESAAANREALWKLLGQGSVFVYLAGYRDVAARMDEAMAAHLRLAGRWQEAKSALQQAGHWLELLYD